MSFKIAAAAGLAALATTVSAHGYVQKIDVAGTEYWGWNNSVSYMATKPDMIAWSDTVTDNGYVAPDAYANADIICHKGAEAGALSAPVNGGDKVTFTWNTWPTSHKGPVITYLAKCDGDCADADKTTLEWFKIDAKGLISGDSNSGTWATDDLISNNFAWDVTIPDSIASGNYVARHEIIALHSADQTDGAQNYPQCVNLKITSSGSDEPTGTLGTALYKEDDAGIKVSIYYPTFTEYDMPGPALYSGSSSSSSGSSSSAAASVASSTVAASSSAVVASSSVAASSAVVASSSAYVASSSIATNNQVASSSAVQTSAAAVQTSAAAAAVVTATATDVVTAQAYTTVTAGASSATQAVVSLASQLPSDALTSTIATEIPTATASGSTAVPTKALPEGTTLEDLLVWVEYLFSEYFAEEKANGANTAAATQSAQAKARRHARDLLAARK